MNPILVFILGWIALGLEMGIRHAALVVRIGSIAAAPSFIIPLVVLVAVSASPSAALWTALIMGLLLDITSPFATSTNTLLHIPGPNALGLVLGAQFVLLVRGFVIRRNPLTLVFLSIAAGIISSICTVAILAMRHIILRDPIVWDSTHELMTRLLAALLTGGTALAMSLVLLPLTPLLGLSNSQGRIRTRR